MASSASRSPGFARMVPKRPYSGMTPPRLGDSAGERVPDPLLYLRGRGPPLLDAATDDRHLVRVQQRCGLQHVERLGARFVIAPLEHTNARLRDALVDAIEDDVLLASRP